MNKDDDRYGFAVLLVILVIGAISFLIRHPVVLGCVIALVFLGAGAWQVRDWWEERRFRKLTGILPPPKDPWTGHVERYHQSTEWLYRACSTHTQFHRTYGPFGNKAEAQAKGYLEACQDRDYFLARTPEVAERIAKRETDERIKEGKSRLQAKEHHDRYIRQIIEYKRRTGKDWVVLDDPRKLTEAGIPEDWNG